MPQLDFFILTSQFNLILIFIFGYLLFIKYLLPNATFILKSYNKSLIKKYNIFCKVSTFIKLNTNTYDTALFSFANFSVISKFYSMNDNTKCTLTLVKKCLKV